MRKGKRVEIREVGYAINYNHKGETYDQTARNIACRILYFCRNHRHLIPAFIGPECREHRCPEWRKPGPWFDSFGSREMCQGASLGEKEDATDDDRNASNFEERHQQLNLTTQDHSAAVQCRKQDDDA